MIDKLSVKLINTVYTVLHISLIILFIVRKEFFSVAGAIFFLTLYLLFLLYEHKKGISITNFVRILVIVTLLSNNFFGEYLRLYTTTVYFDKFLHAFGTFSLSLFTFSLIEKNTQLQSMKKSLIFTYILFLGNFLGTLFEIAEFLCDVIFKIATQNGIADTDIDMICNIFGAALAGIFVVYQKGKQQGNLG